jgi:hypothetical protein
MESVFFRPFHSLIRRFCRCSGTLLFVPLEFQQSCRAQESSLEGQISLHDLPRSRGSVMAMNFVGFLRSRQIFAESSVRFAPLLFGLFDQKPFPSKHTANQSFVSAMRQNDIANAASSGEKNRVWSSGHSTRKDELDDGSKRAFSSGLGCATQSSDKGGAVGGIDVNGSDRKSLDFQNSDGIDDGFCEVCRQPDHNCKMGKNIGIAVGARTRNRGRARREDEECIRFEKCPINVNDKSISEHGNVK